MGNEGGFAVIAEFSVFLGEIYRSVRTWRIKEKFG